MPSNAFTVYLLKAIACRAIAQEERTRPTHMATFPRLVAAVTQQGSEN